jgi:hypothetical protein
MDLLQSLDRRFTWSLLNDSHPANGAIPFRIGKLRLLYFPFALSLCLVRRLSYKPNAWISFTDSNVAALS